WLFGGSASMLARIIFTIVGLAALIAIPALFSSDSSPDIPGDVE
ncbi:DUF378 domain-containing protein, partial [Pygmaiobacter massiliensis]